MSHATTTSAANKPTLPTMAPRGTRATSPPISRRVGCVCQSRSRLSGSSRRHSAIASAYDARCTASSDVGVDSTDEAMPIVTPLVVDDATASFSAAERSLAEPRTVDSGVVFVSEKDAVRVSERVALSDRVAVAAIERVTLVQLGYTDLALKLAARQALHAAPTNATRHAQRHPPVSLGFVPFTDTALSLQSEKTSHGCGTHATSADGSGGPGIDDCVELAN